MTTDEQQDYCFICGDPLPADEAVFVPVETFGESGVAHQECIDEAISRKGK